MFNSFPGSVVLGRTPPHENLFFSYPFRSMFLLIHSSPLGVPFTYRFSYHFPKMVFPLQVHRLWRRPPEAPPPLGHLGFCLGLVGLTSDKIFPYSFHDSLPLVPPLVPSFILSSVNETSANILVAPTTLYPFNLGNLPFHLLC